MPDWLVFVVGLASLIVSIIAICLAIHFKNQADKTNNDTRQVLTKIETESTAVLDSVMAELGKYGDVSRKIMMSNNSLSLGKADSIVVGQGEDFKKSTILDSTELNGMKETSPTEDEGVGN